MEPQIEAVAVATYFGSILSYGSDNSETLLGHLLGHETRFLKRFENLSGNSVVGLGASPTSRIGTENFRIDFKYKCNDDRLTSILALTKMAGYHR